MVSSRSGDLMDRGIYASSNFRGGVTTVDLFYASRNHRHVDGSVSTCYGVIYARRKH